MNQPRTATGQSGVQLPKTPHAIGTITERERIALTRIQPSAADADLFDIRLAVVLASGHNASVSEISANRHQLLTQL
ncbi:hypothetical protein [Allorhodopirellula heiligendammensis]|uniref:hypothetical protein n=1 Tax=Allorhodopirellula heiligendammensis TaxID=2714739 RepID=UPI00265F5E3F|nr:hypothetical protein [Allorhodopirellula heiligendammensis]